MPNRNKHIKVNIKTKKSKNNFKQYFIFGVIFITISIIVSAFFYFQSNNVVVELNTNYALVKAKSSYKAFAFEIPSPNIPRDKENPINGSLMNLNDYNNMLKNNPVAITINNFSKARPQSGLSRADVVGEFLAEGGITRYVPIFYSDQSVEKIGPVRSLRYYMMEFIAEYGDPVILHEGQAGYDNAPWETYREKADARGAISKYDVMSLQSGASRYRDAVKASKNGYVHALYTGFDIIKKELERYEKNLNWKLAEKEIEKLNFKIDLEPEKRGNFNSVSINFMPVNANGNLYDAKFVYNKLTNSYDRYIADKLDIDEFNGKTISPKNVVIEWHKYQNANDGHSRIIIDMIGEGNAEILMDGKVINGKWKKECRECRTRYYTSSGSEIALNRGQIWVAFAVQTGSDLVSSVKYN